MKAFLMVGILVFLVVVFFFISSSITKYTGFFVSSDTLNMPSDFEVCLREKDVRLYLNSNDVAGSLKESGVVDYLDEVDIFNCLRDNQKCLGDGVNEFPTWIIDGRKFEKDISVYELADYSECDLV